MSHHAVSKPTTKTLLSDGLLSTRLVEMIGIPDTFHRHVHGLTG